jgi:biofilm protein TabA
MALHECKDSTKMIKLHESLDSRRQFFSRLSLGGAVYLASAGLGWAEDDPHSRLVQGELKTWRANPRLKQLEAAFRFLEQPGLQNLPLGRHEISSAAYAMIDKSPSLPPEKVQFEAHRLYTDVHYMISGQVTTGYAPIEKLTVDKPYSEKTEAALYLVPANYTRVKLYPGRFAVFFPGGGHMPNFHLDGPHDLHKVVVKVRHDAGV